MVINITELINQTLTTPEVQQIIKLNNDAIATALAYPLLFVMFILILAGGVGYVFFDETYLGVILFQALAGLLLYFFFPAIISGLI